MKYKKAQVSTEFTILIAFMFLIFLVYMGAIQDRAIDFSKNADNILLEQIGQVILTEIDNAAFTENGYKRQFEIPSTLLNKNYDIKICSYYSDYTNEKDYTRNNDAVCGGVDVKIPEIIVKFSDSISEFTFKIPRNVVTQPDSILLGNKNCLRKENNVVYLNHPTYTC